MKWSKSDLKQMHAHRMEQGAIETAAAYGISKARVYQLTRKGPRKTRAPKSAPPVAVSANEKTVKKIFEPREETFLVLVLPASKISSFLQAMR